MRAPSNALLCLAADGVGTVSAVLGGLLTFAPETGRRWLGLTGTGVARTRVLGAADLSLGIAIIATRSSRSRWRAVACRSLLHLVFAGEYVRGDHRRSAMAMCVLFVLDAGIAVALRKQPR
ncbi:hypothetical protein [Microbacterium sp. W4I20]|uniref:hypothetical protein n=1 Tax=Microbacterium sp. W4I20 TaxID=3042262 RepID=UPI002784D657|nr:hypothetical protein [Microbacterium sp. W4I20]MDQ0727842.1 hypothetical protein [Microbacterium sp. W4I20]